MRITPNRDTPATQQSNRPQKEQRTRFSEVLEREKSREEVEDPHELEGAEQPVAPSLIPPQPFLLRNQSLVDAGQSVVRVAPESLLNSLVDEISVVAPPDQNAAVEIRFDSRTFEGLRVRVQKTGEGIEVRLSSSSASVLRLLEANVGKLANALVNRGYVVPAVSVEREPVSPPHDQHEGSRGRQQQGRGQKRR